MSVLTDEQRQTLDAQLHTINGWISAICEARTIQTGAVLQDLARPVTDIADRIADARAQFVAAAQELIAYVNSLPPIDE